MPAESWEDALDEMELALAGSELAPASAWEAPIHLGPLPEALADRARDIHARQQHALAALAQRRSEIRGQLRAVKAVPAYRDPAEPVYLDVAG